METSYIKIPLVRRWNLNCSVCWLLLSPLSAISTTLDTNYPTENSIVLIMEETTLFNTNLFTTHLNGTYPENVHTKKNDPLWILFMDKSQLVMTIIGVIANIVTFVTLTVNGQVSLIFFNCPQ